MFFVFSSESCLLELNVACMISNWSYDANMKGNIYAITAVTSEIFSFIRKKLRNTEDTGLIPVQQMMEFFYC